MAALFYARALETSIESVLLVSRERGLGSWFYDVLVDSSFIAIMIQTAPGSPVMQGVAERVTR